MTTTAPRSPSLRILRAGRVLLASAAATLAVTGLWFATPAPTTAVAAGNPSVTVTTDGLPETVQVGAAYDITVTARLTGWTETQPGGVVAIAGILLSDGTQQGVCTSEPVTARDLPDVTLQCSFTVPPTAGQLEVRVGASTPDYAVDGQTVTGAMDEVVFTHAVAVTS